MEGKRTANAKTTHIQVKNDKIILVTGCFEPSQPLGIISRLKETFIKRKIVERTSKANIRRTNSVRKRSVVRRI